MKLGMIIARRQLTDGNTGRKVVVEIGRPRKVPKEDEYLCPFRILGIGKDEVRAARGIDSVQTLQTVMDAVGYYLVEHPSVKWFGDDLGFPRPDDMKWPKKLVKQVEERLQRERAKGGAPTNPCKAP